MTKNWVCPSIETVTFGFGHHDCFTKKKNTVCPSIELIKYSNLPTYYFGMKKTVCRSIEQPKFGFELRRYFDKQKSLKNFGLSENRSANNRNRAPKLKFYDKKWSVWGSNRQNLASETTVTLLWKIDLSEDRTASIHIGASQLHSLTKLVCSRIGTVTFGLITQLLCYEKLSACPKIANPTFGFWYHTQLRQLKNTVSLSSIEPLTYSGWRSRFLLWK